MAGIHFLIKVILKIPPFFFPQLQPVRQITPMTTSAISHGALVTLPELNPSSPHFKQGASIRVTGKLQEYDVETAIALIVEGDTSLKIDTQNLMFNLRIGSLYQFIGELLINPDDEVILRARVGRNVDGMDLNLYHQTLKLLKDFQAEHIDSTTA